MLAYPQFPLLFQYNIFADVRSCDDETDEDDEGEVTLKDQYNGVLNEGWEGMSLQPHFNIFHFSKSSAVLHSEYSHVHTSHQSQETFSGIA